MKKFYFALTCLVLSSAVYALKASDFKWSLSEEKDGIKVFSAPLHKETGIVPIKAQQVLNYPMPRVLSVLADTNRKMEWIPKLVEAYIIEQVSKYERVEYARYSAPWPFLDRAFVISTKGNYNEKENTINIDIHSVEHTKAPLNSDYVRGNTYIGSVFMRGITKEKTFFEITLLTDFKGNIPTWIVNLVQAKWPYKMFSNLKDQLKKPDIKIWPEFTKYDP